MGEEPLKRCPRCEDFKSRSEFDRAGRCRPCQHEYMREYMREYQRRPDVHARERERRREYNREYQREYQREYRHEHRARRRDAFVEHVKLEVLFERDGGVCGLCNENVDERTGPNRPSIDHVIPLSKGGKHSYANTQLAHLSCNSRKGNRTEEELIALADKAA